MGIDQVTLLSENAAVGPGVARKADAAAGAGAKVRGFFKFDKTAIYDLTAESPSSAAATFKGVCRIGAFSYVGRGSLVKNVTIGRYCSIAPNVTIGPSEHPIDSVSTHPFASGNVGPFMGSREFARIASPERLRLARPTVVGNDVWIGQNVVIRQGVTIGDGAIVAAGAVVGRDIPPYAIYGGVPAKLIRMRFDTETVDALLAIRWWNYDLGPLKLEGVDYGNVQAFIATFRQLHAAGKIMPLAPLVRRFKAERRARKRIPRAGRVVRGNEVAIQESAPEPEKRELWWRHLLSWARNESK